MIDNLTELLDEMSGYEFREFANRVDAVRQRREVSKPKENGIVINPPAKLGDFVTWQDGDGPAPFVFDRMPAGHRCAWSCHWMAAGPNGKPVIVTPMDWGLPLGGMTPAQIEAELQDLIFDTLLASQTFGGTGMEGIFTASMDITVRLLNNSQLIQTMLTNFRTIYDRQRVYINPWNPPQSGMVRKLNRPGWSK
jgi:hypothetical protein